MNAKTASPTILLAEEEQFARTLDRGMALLDKHIAAFVPG